jgi:branched-chain amino acid transport system ATP-binding protein
MTRFDACTSAVASERTHRDMSTSKDPNQTFGDETSSVPLLDVKDLASGYIKGVRVFEGATLSLRSKEVLGILGVNGAGKTSLLRTITGSLPVWQGKILLDGQDITSMKPERVVAMGVGTALEGRRIFTSLSVEENLFLPMKRVRKSVDTQSRITLEDIYDVMPDLYRRRQNSGGALSGGQQQMLAIGRALMSSPKLLVLDEPSLGLSPLFVEQIVAMLRSILDRFDIGILMAEQILWMARELASSLQLMESGTLGEAKHLSKLDVADIANAYLGSSTESNKL